MWKRTEALALDGLAVAWHAVFKTMHVRALICCLLCSKGVCSKLDYPVPPLSLYNLQYLRVLNVLSEIQLDFQDLRYKMSECTAVLLLKSSAVSVLLFIYTLACSSLIAG